MDGDDAPQWDDPNELPKLQAFCSSDGTGVYVGKKIQNWLDQTTVHKEMLLVTTTLNMHILRVNISLN